MKALVNVLGYAVGFALGAALLIFLWQLAWNLLLPVFGVHSITFIQAIAMWAMAFVVTIWIVAMCKAIKR